MREPLLVANASGFYGDRFTAPEEMVRGGPIHVLTGDYLAELTMAILSKARRKSGAGYATTFVAQIERILGTCLDRGVRIVTNAGGLDPRGLAAAVEALAARLGRSPKVAVVEGDDLSGRIEALERAREVAPLEPGAPRRGGALVTANAYLGGWGIREALARDADVVICGRVADASLVVGPAAWWFGWRRDDWDRLAGAAAAGHVIECGTQVTGGNYAFFEEVPGLDHIGFPLVEIREDGGFVVTKHPGTGGLVSIGTVTAQLLYEIDAPRYVTPDVVTRFDALVLEEEGPDRVRVTGARGEPPPGRAKVVVTRAAGFRSSAGVLLAGLDVEKKAALVERALLAALGGRERFTDVDVRLVRRPHPEPRSAEDALAELRVTVRSPDAEQVGRRFSARVVELALASVPGFTLSAPPAREPSPDLEITPCLVGREHVREVVILGGEEIPIPPPPAADGERAPPIPGPAAPDGAPGAPDEDLGPRVRVPLGRLLGARSGDKGGNANLGVWAKTPAAHRFLRRWLTVEVLQSLLPDVAFCAIDRYELPNLRALNFVIHGLLEGGAASSARVDPQAKTLGEWFRAQVADVPAAIL